MASGFLILPDGRCFARRWAGHDAVLRVIAETLTHVPLRNWLLAQLPGPDDEEEVGFGAWQRAADGGTIVRFIDLRLMTPHNQQLFCGAAKRSAQCLHAEPWLNECLAELVDMVHRMERGEPPETKSDWRDVVPPNGGPIGPA